MIGLITGTGFEEFLSAEPQSRSAGVTEWGTASSEIQHYLLRDRSWLWLRRHGDTGGIAPHRINYRANIAALVAAGATEIISVNTAGGIADLCAAGTFVLPDQIIDLTQARESSYYDGEQRPLKHIDFTHPFDANLRQRMARAAAVAKLDLIDTGTYVCAQGPRLETAAEIRAMRILGGDLVGMTAMPEAALARELNVPYASICPIVNRAAGLEESPLSEESIRALAKEMSARLAQLLANFD